MQDVEDENATTYYKLEKITKISSLPLLKTRMIKEKEVSLL